MNVYVSEDKSFKVKVFDFSLSYGLTFTKESEVNRWLSKCDMSYYQNQVNFAVYCTTTLSGLPDIGANQIGSKTENQLTKSVYNFHFNYQVRKILKQLQSPLATDETFNASNNNLNKREFLNLCNEFNISPDHDFRTKLGDNNGLGTMYFMGSKIHGNGFVEHRNHYALPDKHYTFAKSHYMAKIQRLIQNDDGWKYFIATKENLTPAGIIRLNDSIRTFVYCILGAQAETRSAIIGSFGTELDARKQFLKLFEDSINQHADIPTSISRYQKALTDTHSRVDYVIAPGLYIIPSDMILKIGSIKNYNNNILIASKNMKPGKNDINLKKSIPLPSMKGPPVKFKRIKTNLSVGEKPVKPPTENFKPPTEKKEEIITHENIKFLLLTFVGGLATLVLMVH